MKDFDDSFNLFIGIQKPVEEFNWFTNKYIRIKAYEVDENMKADKPISLRMCSREELLTFMTDRVADYYPNSLCFQDKNQIRLMSNWFHKAYKSIMISIEGCQNTGENEEECED